MSNMTDYLKHLARSPLARVYRIKPVDMTLTTILFVLMLTSYQMNAFSQGTNECNAKGDIPFVVSGERLTEELCLVCDGPWFRSSGSVLFTLKSFDNCTFYAANITSFSPFGLWTCFLTLPDDEGFCEGFPIIYTLNFCVGSYDKKANLFIVGNQLATTNSLPPCNSSVSSFLGDNPKQEKSKPDIDVFTFGGTGGDQVTLRLEANPQEGNNGGEAGLEISGNSLNESTSGAPPLEINPTLPADGEYSITVEQPKNSAQRFRGSYILNVESATGVGLIEPTNNVEK